MKYFHWLIIALALILGVGCYFLTGWLEFAFVIITLPAVYTLLHLLNPGSSINDTIVISIAGLIAGYSFFLLTQSAIRLYTTMALLITIIPIIYSVFFLFASWRTYKILLLSLNIFLILMIIWGATGRGYGDIKELIFGFVMPVLVINALYNYFEFCSENIKLKRKKTNG